MKDRCKVFGKTVSTDPQPIRCERPAGHDGFHKAETGGGGVMEWYDRSKEDRHGNPPDQS